MSRDEKYKHPQPEIGDFDFGFDTAQVFDDMLLRSVPFYAELQRMMAELVVDFAQAGTAIYDFGCSTGTTLRQIDSLPLPEDLHLIGIDSSEEMLIKANSKLMDPPLRRPFSLRNENLEGPFRMEPTSVSILCLTLQFVRPLYRERLLKTIADHTIAGGCAIVVEKTLSQDPQFSRLFIHHYHHFKQRNGYSQLEIAQKREALENVLVPFSLEENRLLLKTAGFTRTELFFRWYNFCGLIAVK